SAGDKYETGREMMRQEIERHQQQWHESRKLKQVLDQVNPAAVHTRVALGSLVMTDIGQFYLAISMGKVEVEGQTYFILSPGSPLGQALLSRSAGEYFEMNGKTAKIQAIY